ncbi:hypothetical protein [Nostoc sp.]|uniref:hypothetical protein n=1 Tax=Nostoc sp. TaxID=1180 RepID=UPI002FF75D9C
MIPRKPLSQYATQRSLFWIVEIDRQIYLFYSSFHVFEPHLSSGHSIAHWCQLKLKLL